MVSKLRRLLRYVRKHHKLPSFPKWRIVKVKDESEPNLKMRFKKVRPKLRKALKHFKKKLKAENMRQINEIADLMNNMNISSFKHIQSYCNNFYTECLTELSKKLLRKLKQLQHEDSDNAMGITCGNSRYICGGFQEAETVIKNHDKVELLLIANDCRSGSADEDINKQMDELKVACEKASICYGFVLCGKQMAFELNEKAEISYVAILNTEGVQELMSELLTELDSAKQQYKAK